MKKRRQYKLIHKKKFKWVPDDYMDEQEYFEYCQNSSDPTLELNQPGQSLEVVDSKDISYYDTVLNLLNQDKELSLLFWQDFQKFVSEWVLFRGWSSSMTNKIKNGGVHVVTTKKDRHIGFIKCIWIIKKYSSRRVVGIKAIRELDYLIGKNSATKGVIVTSSRLSAEAIKLLEDNCFTMNYFDNVKLKDDLLNFKNEDAIIDDLPF